MSITRQAANATKTLSSSAALSQLCRNTGNMFRNRGRQILFDPAAFSRDALVIAGWSQAFTRTATTHISAHKEKGTDNGPFAFWRAINTTLREILGCLLNYTLLRFLSTRLKAGFQRHFGLLVPQPARSMFSQWREALGHAWRREAHQPLDTTHALPKIDKFEIQDSAKFKQAFAKAEPWLKKIPGLAGHAPEEMITRFVRWAPLIISAFPTVLFAGYLLERFTREHADDTVNLLSRWCGGPSSQKTSPQKSFAVSPMAGVGGNGFGNYYSGIQQKRMIRGFNAFQQTSSPEAATPNTNPMGQETSIGI